jgi:hypothetical protein
VSLARIDSLSPGSVVRDQPPGILDISWEPLPAPSFESHFKGGPAILSTMGFTTLQAIGRLPNEATRRHLDGPFLNDWFEAAAGLFDNNWSDGNKAVTNYVAHPVGGSVYGNIARQNSKYRGLLPGDEGYVLDGAGRSLLYKHIVSKIESRNAHNFWHRVLNPSRFTANVFGARKPWAR